VKIQNSQYLSALQIPNQFPVQSSNTRKTVLQPEGGSFQDILAGKTGRTEGELKFSKHAANRLADRNIRLTDEQMGRLSDGTQKAGAKGIKESLVIVDQLAFIVNIPNRTVVTAMDQAETEENIFTNIDGAVIM
jgi:flagellar operon protein